MQYIEISPVQAGERKFLPFKHEDQNWIIRCWVVEVHTSNPSTLEGEASLVCRASPRKARATQKSPVLKNENKQNKT